MNDSWDYASARWLEQRRGTKWFEKDQGRVSILSDRLAGLKLSDITAAKIAEVREDLARDRAAGTVNRLMGVARTILNTARDEWQLIAAVPKVKRLKEKERVRFLTHEEAGRLIEALPRRMRPLVRFALATGLRQSNVLNLEWSEVSGQHRWIAIPGEKMKNGEPFGAPLNEAAVAILAKQRGKHPRWVFPIHYAGEYGPMKGIDNATWKKACAEAGIEDFTFHDLRHTWASWHLQAGTHPHALRELGGWRDDAMVKRYAHLAKHHLAEAASNIGQVCSISSLGATSRQNSRSAQSKLGD